MAVETTRITVRLPLDVAEKIEKSATSKGLTVSDYVRDSLSEKSVTEAVKNLRSDLVRLVNVLAEQREKDRAVLSKISDRVRRSANAGKIISAWCDLMAKQLGKDKEWSEAKNKVVDEIVASGDGG